MQPLSKLKLFPRHQRRMNHIRNAMAANGADREIHIFQSKCVRGDLLERNTLGSKLLERKFAGLVTVAACALDGDEFYCDFADWKVWELRHFTLDDDGPPLAFKRIHAQQNRHGARAGCAIQDDVHTTAVRD